MLTYDYITQYKSGWSLAEVRALPVRERRFWVSMIQWGNESG